MIRPVRSTARLLARAVARLVGRDGLFEMPGERHPVRAPSPPPAPAAPAPEPAECCCSCGCETP